MGELREKFGRLTSRVWEAKLHLILINFFLLIDKYNGVNKSKSWSHEERLTNANRGATTPSPHYIPL